MDDKFLEYLRDQVKNASRDHISIACNQNAPDYLQGLYTGKYDEIQRIFWNYKAYLENKHD